MPKYNVECLTLPAAWGLLQAESADEAARMCAEQLYENNNRHDKYRFRVHAPERGISAEISVCVAPSFYTY